MLSGSQIPELVLSVDSLIFISTTPHALKGDRSFYEPPSHKSARTPLSRLPVKDVWAGTSLHAMGKGSSMWQPQSRVRAWLQLVFLELEMWLQLLF